MLHLPAALFHAWAADGLLETIRQDGIVFTTIIFAERCLTKAREDRLHDHDAHPELVTEREEAGNDNRAAAFFADSEEDDAAVRDDEAAEATGSVPFSARDHGTEAQPVRRRRVFLSEEQLGGFASDQSEQAYDPEAEDYGVSYHAWLTENQQRFAIAYLYHVRANDKAAIIAQRGVDAKTVTRALDRAQEAFEWYCEQRRKRYLETPADELPSLRGLPQAPRTDARLQRGDGTRGRILASIDQILRETGQAPSTRSLAAALKLSPSGVHRHLQVLEQEGRAQRDAADTWRRTPI